MKTKYLKYIFQKIFGFYSIISAQNSNLARKIKKYNLMYTCTFVTLYTCIYAFLNFSCKITILCTDHGINSEKLLQYVF